MEVASVRFKNPGAMWGDNAISKKWGQVANHKLNDGLRQGNKCAEFPDFEHGAAAQFDLWRTKYTPMTLGAAIHKWSGANSSPAYTKYLAEHVGLGLNSMIDVTTLKLPVGWKLMKAQASWEAGKPYPMTDAQWQKAQAMCFGTAPVTSTPKKKAAATTAVVVATGTAVTTAAKQGHGGLVILSIIIVGIAIAIGAYIYLHRNRE